MAKQTRRVNRRRSKKQRGGEQNTIERLQDFFVQKQILGTNANVEEHGQYLDHSIGKLDDGYGAIFCKEQEDCNLKNPIYFAPYPSLEWTISKADTKQATVVTSAYDRIEFAINDYVVLNGKREKIISFGSENEPQMILESGIRIASGNDDLNFITRIPGAPKQYVFPKKAARSRKRVRK